MDNIEILARAYNEKLHGNPAPQYNADMLDILREQLEIIEQLLRARAVNVKVCLYIKALKTEMLRLLYSFAPDPTDLPLPPQNLNYSVAELYRKETDLFMLLDKAKRLDHRYSSALALAERALSFLAGVK